MEDRKSILNRMYIAAIPFFLMAVFVLIKLFIIQYAEGPDLRARSQKEVIREINIQADRGNIFSSDGKLLATSMPVYDLFMDPYTVAEEDFTANISALSLELGKKFPVRSARQWETYLRMKRDAKSRYVRLGEDISFSDLQKIREFPIFNLGRYKGGLIYEQKNYRKMPLGKIAERTIGYDHLRGRTGIEGAFSSFLSGTDGVRLKQKVSKGNWKPVTDSYEIEPEDGLDVVTTIDTKIQDIVHHELLKALERFEADHGCAVVMDVKTGAIRGIANLGRTEEGTYFEKRNYAVWESTEPGSTFKLASVMIALEDGIADTNTLVDTENGLYEIYGKKIKDSNYRNGKGGYGRVTLKRAFEVSSNVGIVKLIYDNYKDEPSRFVDRLYTLGLHDPLGLAIKGEGTPLIPKPGDKNWSGITLPWMAFGYQVSFTPLQVLTLYNAVANDGTMIKPRFIESISKHGKVIQNNEVQVINPSICSKETLAKVRSMLDGVVENGTATNLQSPLVKIAGKTGTCQLNYWKRDTRDYQASFAGYFPADNPQYTCIVVVNKPNNHMGYYGSTVAGPVFKAIAENIYLDTPRDLDQPVQGFAELLGTDASNDITVTQKKVPNLKGKSGSDALSILENHGYKVKIKGNGKVIWQYPPAGSDVGNSALIELKLG
ncbi:penicillin-binding protein [Owenweeksia hongkongensis]|uniref:penicillin-binding protein n=1 Tax=Owenweeksia hongkongensis TaxID=253245 RepID=UPI003A8F7AFC